MLIGYDNQGEAVGVEKIEKLLEDVPNKVRDVLGIMVEVNLVKHQQLKTLHIITEAYPYPVSYKGEYHYRSGSTKQELKGAALDKFLMRKHGITWDSVPVPYVQINDLDSKALSHFRRQAIQISIYPNKLMLWNPGQLPENWTLEKLLSKHESIPYNPEIANAFFRAGLIESWGRGIERIIETCKKEGYPLPEWKVEPNGLWVVFTFEIQEKLQEMVEKDRLRPIKTDYDRLKPIKTDKELTYEQAKIIQLATENLKIARKDVVALLDLSESKVKQILNSLLDEQVLERHGQGRGTYYQLKTS